MLIFGMILLIVLPITFGFSYQYVMTTIRKDWQPVGILQNAFVFAGIGGYISYRIFDKLWNMRGSIDKLTEGI